MAITSTGTFSFCQESVPSHETVAWHLHSATLIWRRLCKNTLKDLKTCYVERLSEHLYRVARSNLEAKQFALTADILQTYNEMPHKGDNAYVAFCVVLGIEMARACGRPRLSKRLTKTVYCMHKARRVFEDNCTVICQVAKLYTEHCQETTTFVDIETYLLGDDYYKSN